MPTGIIPSSYGVPAASADNAIIAIPIINANTEFIAPHFSVLESELQDVLKTLRSGGINVVAIHHHMTDENPRYLFLHYWGKGPVTQLTKVLRSALDKTKHE